MESRRLASLGLALLAFVLVLPAAALASTNVGGIISSDTRWTAAGSPYVITSPVQVEHDATLTVEPGVMVSGGSIQAWGTLDAAGTADRPIRFQSVEFKVGDAHDRPGRLALAHCRITGGKLLSPTGNGAYGSIRVTDSVYKYAERYTYLWYPVGECVFERNVLRDVGITGGHEIRDGHAANTITFTNNLFVGSSSFENWAAYGGPAQMHLNSFYNITASSGAVSLPKGYDSSAIDATRNYWNGVDPSTLIYDRNDDLGCASVIPYAPVLTSPDPATPSFDPTPPTITVGGVSEGGTYGQAVQLTFGSPDADLDLISAKLDGIDCVSGSEASWGSHSLVVNAEDIVGNRSTRTVAFTVVPSMSLATVTGISATYTYTGNPITPVPVVALVGKTLTGGVDYTVSYTNNILPGKATVAVAGKGAYAGTTSRDFTITLGSADSERSVYLAQKTTLTLTGSPVGVLWSSSDATVASVTGLGVVTGLRSGITTISASWSGSTVTWRVTVLDPEFDNGGEHYSISVGSKKTLKIVGGSGAIRWKSSNSGVASVSSKGVVRGIKGGKVTITAWRNSMKITTLLVVDKRDYKLSLSRGVSGGKGYIYVTARTWNSKALAHRKVKLYRSGSYVGSMNTDSRGKARLRVEKNRVWRSYRASVAGDSRHTTTSASKDLRFAKLVFGRAATDMFTRSVYLRPGMHRITAHGTGLLTASVGGVTVRGTDGDWVNFRVRKSGYYTVTGTSWTTGGLILVEIDMFL